MRREVIQTNVMAPPSVPSSASGIAQVFTDETDHAFVQKRLALLYGVLGAVVLGMFVVGFVLTFAFFPEKLWELVSDLDPDTIDRITHRNAMDAYRFDPFSVRPEEQCTAAALRAEVGEVDTVTHVGRLADETDRNAWRTMTGAAAKAGATK